MNSAILSGRLTADPELRTTTSGIEVASFCIAIDRYAKSNEEKKADFINIVAWRKSAVFVNTYFHKGDGIEITGSIQTRKYQDKEGNNRIAFEVVADNVGFTIGKKSDNSGSNYNPAAKPSGIDVIEDNSTPASPDNKNVGDFAEISADDVLPF